MTQPAGLAAVWGRIKKNAAIILGERIVFGLLNLAAAALAVRAVGVEGFGVVVLLQAYVRLIAGLLKFQSWAAVTRFGAECVEQGRAEDFRRLIGFTLRLDAIGFAVSICLAILLAPYAAAILSWPEEAASLAVWFALVIPFITAGTPTGMLRLFDRFAVLAQQHALNAIVRFLGVLGLFLSEGGVAGLIVIWASASIVSGGYMIAIAFAEARRRRLLPRLVGRWSTLTAGFPRIWRFVIVLNATSLMETILSHATVLVVGAMLGATAAGLFGIVRQLTESLNRISSLLGPIIFPEFAWMEARGDRRAIAKLLWRTLVYCGGGLAAFCLFLLIAGEHVLVLLFDTEAAPAAPLLVAAGAAAAFMALGFAMEPVMLTIRKEKALLASAVASTIVFGPLLYGLITLYGLLGAGLALLARQILIFVHRLWVLRRALAQRTA